jgi:hypothetical protein
MSIDEIWNRVETGFKRRDDSHIKRICELYKDPGSGLIPKENLRDALKDLGIAVRKEDVDNLFLEVDLNNDGGVDLLEFTRALQITSAIEQWAGSLPLSQMLSDAILGMEDKEAPDPLRKLSQITADYVGQVCDVFKKGLNKVVLEAIDALRKSFEEMDKLEAKNDAAEKFQVIKMSVGSVEHFHQGLAARLGEQFKC